MKTLRRGRSVALLVALVAGCLLSPASAARAVGGWVPTGPMMTGRFYHTATLLPSGLVLVAGGRLSTGVPTNTAERYVPGTQVWDPASPMNIARFSHTATLLPSGQVLVAGGQAQVDGGQLVSAEVYDPTADRWTAVAPMGSPRSLHTATLLPNGQVLIAGGRLGTLPGGHALASAELYDPATQSWRPVASMHTPRFSHTATLLPNGQVLVVGGATDGGAATTAELYNPTTNTWRAAASPANTYVEHAAILLRDGQVLVVGGGPYGLAAERYDPLTDRWSSAGPTRIPHDRSAATLLPNGQVLVTGGDDSTPSAEVYDPVVNAWAGTAAMHVGRHSHTATLLPNGQVLVAGGASPRAADERTAELYQPQLGPEACFPQTGKCIRGPFLGYWLAHGGLALNGYPLSDEFVQVLDDGRAYQVQYFERVRMEYHPENPAPYDIELGQFGRHVLQATTGQAVAPTAAPIPGQAYFSETGHNLGGAFLAYWQQDGGLMQFGFPISEVFQQRLEDGKTYTVQYFERARLEEHPENPPPWNIELGQFGRRILAESGR